MLWQWQLPSRHTRTSVPMAGFLLSMSQSRTIVKLNVECHIAAEITQLVTIEVGLNALYAAFLRWGGSLLCSCVVLCPCIGQVHCHLQPHEHIMHTQSAA